MSSATDRGLAYIRNADCPTIEQSYADHGQGGPTLLGTLKHQGTIEIDLKNKVRLTEKGLEKLTKIEQDVEAQMPKV